MTIGLKEIRLNESYFFHVKVRDGAAFFAGELNLTPARVTLKIMGEEVKGRNCGIRFKRGIDHLICQDLNCTFLLLGLTATSGIGSLLEHYPHKRSYFEAHFEVEDVIYFPTHMQSNTVFLGLELHSDTIDHWIGNTITQEKIIHAYKTGDKIFNNRELLEEFSVPVEKEGRIGIGYAASVHYSLPDFSAGIIFPPSLYFAFKQQKNAVQTIQLLHELYTLFAFLTGDEIEIDKIVLIHSNIGFNNSATLYYPRNRYPTRNRHSLQLFPLGRNLRFDTLGLPEFPLESINKYFMLGKVERLYFHKYVRYRRLYNVEERFLGYFRILESLCYKEKSYLDNELLVTLTKRAKPYLVKYFGDQKAVTGFLRNLPRFNSSKYNTEKCIGDFFSTIPVSESRRWIYQKKDLGRICKLRNDISHANDHEVKEIEIEKMAKICEVLLVIALFLKLNISAEIAIAVISRLKSYDLATKPTGNKKTV